jgi:RNA polymerase sigma-70 factor (ECF subfamily)
VTLYYLFDMSVQQIAAETGAPTGTVTSWLHRGRAELAALLSPEPSRLMGVNDVE